MTEGERFSEMRRVAGLLKDRQLAGRDKVIADDDSGNENLSRMERRDRRDRVIGEMASDSMSGEPEDVIQTAVDKYFEVNVSGNPKPVVFDAVHAVSPEADLYTGEIVEKIGDKTRESWLRAKWSRDTKADANRKPFRREERSTAKKGTKTREKPTSVRAALYWGIEKVIKAGNWLDSQGKLTRPFLRVAVHGQSNRSYTEFGEGGEVVRSQPVDMVLGGGSLDPDKQIVSRKVLDWFARSLVTKLADEGVVVGIESMGRDEADVYKMEDGVVVVEQIKKTKESGTKSGRSGAGLGLEDFRFGKKYKGRDLSGKFRWLRVPGFGVGFQTVQLEIARTYREDVRLRGVTEDVLGEIALEFTKEFSDLSSLD